MTEFKTFADVVHRRFTAMSKNELYVVAADGDGVWAAYLAAFPAGTNPMFRERTEHDCSTCRHFVKNIGNVVGIVDGKPRSVWAGSLRRLEGQRLVYSLWMGYTRPRRIYAATEKGTS